jgi:hypothetical protein
MRTGSYRSGVRFGRSRCPRTVLHRTNSTSDSANPVASVKVLKLFLVPQGRIIQSAILLLATRGRRVELAGGLEGHVVIRMEEVERWISV